MEDKDKFGVSMEAQLKQWQERIEQSKADAAKKGPEFLKKFAPDLERLNASYDEARYKLKLLKMSGGEAWAELKHGVEKAFDELKSAVGKALEKF
jgi:DNA-binding protein HU-beta